MRAMVLAAGFGTRLRPFTEQVPKPLLPVANRPLLDYTFSLLAGAGVTEVVVNAHHLADRLAEGVRDLARGRLRAHLSRERTILGTAGGLRKAAPLLREGTFLLLNGDFLVDIDLPAVVDLHRQRGAMATMVLREEPGGRVCTDGEGRIRSVVGSPSPEGRGWTALGFTGIHVLEPPVLDLIPPGRPWEINLQVYPEMIRRGWPLFGHLHRGYWREAGDPAGLLAAQGELLNGRAGAIAVAPGAGALPGRGAGIVPPVIVGAGALLEEGAILGPDVAVGPGCRVGRGARISRSLLLDGTEVPAGTRWDSAILSPRGALRLGEGGGGSPTPPL